VKKFNGKEKTPPLKNNPKKSGGELGGDKTKGKNGVPRPMRGPLCRVGIGIAFDVYS
jgi:hypothetical protein